MSYTLTVVNRTPITIQNGATDSSTSLTLVGKNYPNYGQIIEQDLIYLMQNFAGVSQPVNPVTGQLWWSTTSNNLQVYNGTTWVDLIPQQAGNAEKYLKTNGIITSWEEIPDATPTVFLHFGG